MNRLPHAKISAQDVASYLQNLSIELKHTQLLEVVARSRGFKNYHILKKAEHSLSDSSSDGFSQMTEQMMNQCVQSNIDSAEFIQWMQQDGMAQLFEFFNTRKKPVFTITKEQFAQLNEANLTLNKYRRRIQGEYKDDINTASKCIRDVLLAIEYPQGIEPVLLFQKAPPAGMIFTDNNLGHNEKTDEDQENISTLLSENKFQKAIATFLDTTRDARFFIKNGMHLWHFLHSSDTFKYATLNEKNYLININKDSEVLSLSLTNDKHGKIGFELDEEQFAQAVYLDDKQWLIAGQGVMTFSDGEHYLESERFVVENDGQKPYAVIHDNALAYEDIVDLEQAQNTARMLAENERGTLAYVEDVLGRCVYMFVDGFIPVKHKIDNRKKLF
jgi:hypothetical protein